MPNSWYENIFIWQGRAKSDSTWITLIPSRYHNSCIRLLLFKTLNSMVWKFSHKQTQCNLNSFSSMLKKKLEISIFQCVLKIWLQKLVSCRKWLVTGATWLISRSLLCLKKNYYKRWLWRNLQHSKQWSAQGMFWQLRPRKSANGISRDCHLPKGQKQISECM